MRTVEVVSGEGRSYVLHKILDYANLLKKNPSGIGKLAVPGAITSKFRQVVAAAVKFLDTVVAGVGDPNIATAINIDAPWSTEFPISVTGCPKLRQVSAGTVKFLNTVIVGIGHQQIAA